MKLKHTPIVLSFVFSLSLQAATPDVYAPLPFPLGTVTGHADYHVHQFAHLGYDGRLLWGSADGAEATALKSCNGTNHAVSWIPGLITGLAVSPELGMHNFGTHGQNGGYKDWPLWSTVTHQQVWEGWLKKAHQDGLNLIVMSAVNFRYICGIMPRGNGFYDTSGGTKPCDDMKNVKRQLEAARAFAAKNSSWYEIALTPAHARRIIQEGKLAVVLAIEASEIFNNVNTEADLDRELDTYQALGVRSIQPVHELNNKFGGTAYFQKMFDLVQAFVNVKSFVTAGLDGSVDELKSAFDGIKVDSNKNNIQGLTPLGKALIQKLIDRKMIVDVAHLSTKSMNDTYAISSANRYYPLLMSHTHFRQMFRGKLIDEKKIPVEGVKLVKKTGGVIGLRTGNEKQNTYGRGSVANNCHGSSRSFAQSYMLGAIGYGIPLGFASDFNGFIDQMRPRFYDSNAKYGGSAEKWACGEDTNGEEREVARAAQGNRASAGTGSEFDLIGYAHIGYTKNIMQDLNRMGVDTVVVANSAEAFLKMWDRAYDPNRAAKSDTVDSSGVIVTSADDEKCPSLRAKLGTLNNKVVCKALPHFSIKDKNCDGSRWNGFCVWNEGSWYRAREIR
ncbi:MAG: membrane dipeptidase [Leptospirales bacterium]|nr:membrane dipeptidase [Leptospirales bacterium]